MYIEVFEVWKDTNGESNRTHTNTHSYTIKLKSSYKKIWKLGEFFNLK